MKLIMNADDLGLSRAVNFGIIDAYTHGIVRSATTMANMPGFEHGVKLAKENPGLGVGIHLVLTCGKAVGGPYQTITDKEGNFLKQLKLIEMAPDQIDLEEVRTEFDAQILKVLSAGIAPTHLDSHHHMHELPGIIDIFCEMAEKYKLPVRMEAKAVLPERFQHLKMADVFLKSFYGDNITAEELKKSLDRCSASGVVEVMCHPAYLDQEAFRLSSYNIPRTRELEVIMSSEMADYIEEKKIELVNFRDLV